MKKRYLAYLIYLIMVTAIVTAMSFSRYATTVTASDTARVARPVLVYQPVSATLSGIPIGDITDGITVADALPGDELVYSFNVKNFENTSLNEVLLKYKVTITFDPSVQTIPLTSVLTPSGTYDSAGDGWIYLGIGSQVTHSYTLTVSWDELDNNAEYENQEQKINIQVDAQQVD